MQQFTCSYETDLLEYTRCNALNLAENNAITALCSQCSYCITRSSAHSAVIALHVVVLAMQLLHYT